MPKQTKVIIKRKKFIDVEIPLLNSKIELIGNSPKELENKTIKIDLTRHLKGKSVEGTFKIISKDNKVIANPYKIKLMPYFIRRMIRKKISYVEDSFLTPSQESMLIVKPFLITRKRVSKAVRKTLRNKARNWIEDYFSDKNNEEIFTEILSNKIQKPLSLILKKTYPLSLCEIRILELKRPLEKEEIPKKKPKEMEKEDEKNLLDEIKGAEDEKIKEAQLTIKETQKKATKKEKEIERASEEKEKLEEKSEDEKSEESSEKSEDKTKNTRKKTVKK